MQIKARFLLLFYFLGMAVLSFFYPGPGIRMMQNEKKEAEERNRKLLERVNNPVWSRRGL